MTDDKADNMEQLADSIRPKPARALWLWLSVICAVLIMLWLETRHGAFNNYNLLLNGEPETVGATVFIDDKNVGVMVNSNQSGVDGSTFFFHLNDGKHAIEVKKDGFDTFHENIDLHSQGYVNVELKKSHTGN